MATFLYMYSAWLRSCSRTVCCYFPADVQRVATLLQMFSAWLLSCSCSARVYFPADVQHVVAFRRILQDKERNLEAMREMSASRASLSMLDISSRDDSRPMSESSGSDHPVAKTPIYKSLENLDVSVYTYF